MPNWCNNSLSISCEKEHSQELASFKEKAKHIANRVAFKDLEKTKAKYLKENKKRYRDKIDEFAEHSAMSVEDFFKNVLYYKPIYGTKDYGTKDFCESSTELSLTKFYPTPEELENEKAFTYGGENKEEQDNLRKELVKKYGFENGNSWRVANWGCKWDVDAKLSMDTETEICYLFDTAWSPCVNWLGEVSKQYPNLKFHLYYDEPGMGFKGEATAVDGDLHDECFGYTDEDYEIEEEN
jgi:hypothetical protein